MNKPNRKGLFETDEVTGITSAGTKIPDFIANTREEAEQFRWQMKTYEENILPRQYPQLYAQRNI